MLNMHVVSFLDVPPPLACGPHPARGKPGHPGNFCWWFLDSGSCGRQAEHTVRLLVDLSVLAVLAHSCLETLVVGPSAQTRQRTSSPKEQVQWCLRQAKCRKPLPFGIECFDADFEVDLKNARLQKGRLAVARPCVDFCPALE